MQSGVLQVRGSRWCGQWHRLSVSSVFETPIYLVKGFLDCHPNHWYRAATHPERLLLPGVTTSVMAFGDLQPHANQNSLGLDNHLVANCPSCIFTRPHFSRRTFWCIFEMYLKTRMSTSDVFPLFSQLGTSFEMGIDQSYMTDFS